MGHFHRTYALDFWGFGESGKKHPTYAVSDYVEQVRQFMDQLGIRSAPIVGHSMGGTVALSFALKYPEKVRKVAVVGSPIAGWSLNPFLIAAGFRPLAALAYNSPNLFRMALRIATPIISKHPGWYDMQVRDLSRTTLSSFFASIASVRRTDLRPVLKNIDMPVMGIYGKSDNIVNPNQHAVLRKAVPHAQIALFEKSAHFPMLDEPEHFNRTLRKYLSEQAA